MAGGPGREFLTLGSGLWVLSNLRWQVDMTAHWFFRLMTRAKLKLSFVS